MARNRPREESTHHIPEHGIGSSVLGGGDDTDTKRTRVVRDDDDLLSFLDTAFALERKGSRAGVAFKEQPGTCDLGGEASTSGCHHDGEQVPKDVNVGAIATTAISMVKQRLALTPPAPSFNQTHPTVSTISCYDETLSSWYRNDDPSGRGIQDARCDEQRRRRNRDYMRAYRQREKNRVHSPAEGGVLLPVRGETADDEPGTVLRPVCDAERAEALKRLQDELGPSGMDECVCVSCDRLVPRRQSIQKEASDWKLMEGIDLGHREA